MSRVTQPVSGVAHAQSFRVAHALLRAIRGRAVDKKCKSEQRRGVDSTDRQTDKQTNRLTNRLTDNKGN